jgi:hypothetical protein
MGSLLNKFLNELKCQLLNEENLGEIGVRLVHSLWKSLRCLAQNTGILELSAQIPTKLLKLKPLKTTVVHEMQACGTANKVNFYIWILQSVHESQVDPHLIFLSDEASFHLHSEVNSQTSKYGISHNPR